MKNLFVFLLALLSTAQLAFGNPRLVTADKYYDFKGQVRKMTLWLNYGTKAKQSYWYDSDGKLIQYALQQSGTDGKITVRDTLTDDGHGRELRSHQPFPQPKYTLPGAHKRHYIYVKDDYGNWTLSRKGDRPDSSNDTFYRAFVYEDKLQDKADVRREFLDIEKRRAAYIEELKSKDTLTDVEKTYLTQEELDRWDYVHSGQKDEDAKHFAILFSLLLGGFLILVELILYFIIRGRFVKGYDGRPTHDKPRWFHYLVFIAMFYLSPFAGIFFFVIPNFIVAGILFLIYEVSIPVVWFSKFESRIIEDMLYNKRLSNGFIRFAKFLWLLFGCLYIWAASLLIPGVGLLIGLFLCWLLVRKYRRVLIWRCPRCHEYERTDYLGRNKDGVSHVVSHNTSSSVDKYDLDDKTEEEREVTTRTRTDSDYQMYKDTFRCAACGFEWERRFRGELLERQRHTTRRTKTTRKEYY